MPGCRGRKIVLTIMVVVFWAAMMSALVIRQAGIKFRPSAYQAFLNKDTLLSDQWLGIYFGGALVGFMHTNLEPYLIRDGVSGYRITNRTFLNVFMMRQQTKVWFDSAALIDENYQLVSFESEFNSGKHRIAVRGKPQGKDHLVVDVDSHGTMSRRSIPIPRKNGVVIASMMSPFQSFGRLVVGGRYDVQIFNPFTMEIEPVRVTVSAREIIQLPQGPEDAFAVDTEYRGIAQRAWVNKNGEILKQQTVMGWEIIKEDADVVQRVYERGGYMSAELLDMASVSVAMPREPMQLQRLTMKISGVGSEFSLASHRQRLVEYDPLTKTATVEISRKPEPSQKIAFPQTGFPQLRQTTALIQCDDPLIRFTAQSIVAPATDSWEAAVLINRWVFEQIRKTPVISIPSAIDVIKTREGDCNEHTVLFTALARAAGIPCQMNVGLAYANGRFYYHAWPSVYVGEWVDMDPTFGQNIVDVAHIRLIEGDLSKQLDIIQLLGRISLEVICAQ